MIKNILLKSTSINRIIVNTPRNNFINYTHKVIQYNRSNFCEKFNRGNLPTVKTGFERFIAAIKKHLFKRVVIFRVLFYGSIVLIIFTILRYSNNQNFAKNVTPVFFLKNVSDLNTFYNVAGIIKPGSISYVKGMDEMNFILTDYEHELKVFHKGVLPQNFLEGNTCVVTGTITDINRPFIFMSTKLLTDHSYNSDKWLNRKLQKNNSDRNGIIEDMINQPKENLSKGYVSMK